MEVMVFFHMHAVSSALWILVSSGVSSNPHILSTKAEFSQKMNSDASKRLTSDINNRNAKELGGPCEPGYCFKPLCLLN